MFVLINNNNKKKQYKMVFKRKYNIYTHIYVYT